jgi:malonyl CoA-acyl carrier protein transacylase
MKTAHVYPGLRYKTGILKKEIGGHPAARQHLDQGSAVLGREVTDLCRDKQPFVSTTECFVASLAVQVAAGIYQTAISGPSDVIVGSSYGHYAALVMAGALDYAAALSAVKNIGTCIDEYFSSHITLLTNGIPYDTLQAFISNLPRASLIDYTDGFAITTPQETREALGAFIQDQGGRWQSTPLRLKYHSGTLSEIEHLIKPEILKLDLGTPRLPIISTSIAGYVANRTLLRQILVGLFSEPIQLEETVAFMAREKLEKVHINPYRLRVNQ